MYLEEEKKDELSFILTEKAKKFNTLVKSLESDYKDVKYSDFAGKESSTLKEILRETSRKFDMLNKELEAPFKIAVIGSQGTGKSTIINLLLEESIMPTSIDENESAVIRLVYPRDESLVGQSEVIYIDGKKEIVPTNQILKMVNTAKNSKEEKEKAKKIAYITVYSKNEQLKKTEIINTPGMNVMTDNFYPKVQKLFIEADVILWVNSAEKILDNFNSWLIKKIYADNDKIIGLITFPDKLYQMDEEKGVANVVEQFMERIENNQILRVNGKIALFIFNGRFAEIASGINKKALFINDLDDLEEEENKLRMIYNYLHHGFAYSDSTSNIEILKKHKLYGINEISNEQIYSEDFNLEKFYSYCKKEECCKEIKEKNYAEYTDKGRDLLGEVSQFRPFERFVEQHLNTEALGEKYSSVLNKLKQIIKAEEGSKKQLENIKLKFEEKINQLAEEEKNRLEAIEQLNIKIKETYNNWIDSQIEYNADKFTDEFLDDVFEKLEEQVSWTDFVKEILSPIPNLFRKEKLSPVGKIMNEIIESSWENILIEHQKKLVEKARDKIEYILIDEGKENTSKSMDLKTKIIKKDIKVPIDRTKVLEMIFEKEFVKRIRKKMEKKIEEKIKELLIKIAKKDLRKKRSKIMKMVIKKLRKLLKKVGIKVLKKEAKKFPLKVLEGPVGWMLLAKDLWDIAKDFSEMYKEMKENIKEQLKHDDSYRKMFIEIAKENYRSVLNNYLDIINKEFSENNEKISYYLKAVEVCDEALSCLNELLEIKELGM